MNLHLPLAVAVGRLLALASSDAVKWYDWKPATDGWVALMDRRLDQVKRIQIKQERFDGHIVLATQGMLVPNFTSQGFKVQRMPEGVHRRLKLRLAECQNEGRGMRMEHGVDQISGPSRRFCGLPMATQIMRELQADHEAWAGGVKLIPQTAYGLRIYGPGNSLTMHTDRLSTHVISSILHVDRDVDEPWPIVIEGYDGKTYEVDLQPGEMLFYESAKCTHGRPRPLKGRWYTSLFMHYAPADWSVNTQDAISLFGEHWRKPLPPDDAVPALRMRGTGMYHPGCTPEWCSLAKDWPPSVEQESEL